MPPRKFASFLSCVELFLALVLCLVLRFADLDQDLMRTVFQTYLLVCLPLWVASVIMDVQQQSRNSRLRY